MINNEFVDKLWANGPKAENKKAQYDCMTKNIITFVLNLDECFRVSQCTLTKKMWDMLEVTHEGTLEVKRSKKHALIQEHELFRLQQRETVIDVHKRFKHIVNHLISFGKVFDKEELNIKILKCLDRSWKPKIIVISKFKDMTALTIIASFGKL